MIKYFCDKCGKELPKADKCDCKLTVTGFKGFDDTFNAIYCVECLKEIIGADNWDELVYKKEERRKRIKEREEKRRKAAMGDAKEKSLDNSDGNNYFITDAYTDIENLVMEMTEKEGGKE